MGEPLILDSQAIRERRADYISEVYRDLPLDGCSVETDLPTGQRVYVAPEGKTFQMTGKFSDKTVGFVLNNTGPAEGIMSYGPPGNPPPEFLARRMSIDTRFGASIHLYQDPSTVNYQCVPRNLELEDEIAQRTFTVPIIDNCVVMFRDEASGSADEVHIDIVDDPNPDLAGQLVAVETPDRSFWGKEPELILPNGVTAKDQRHGDESIDRRYGRYRGKTITLNIDQIGYRGLARFLNGDADHGFTAYALDYPETLLALTGKINLDEVVYAVLNPYYYRYPYRRNPDSKIVIPEEESPPRQPGILLDGRSVPIRSISNI